MRFAGIFAFALLACGASAQVSYDRLLHSDKEPQNWLTYSGNYSGWHYSLLDQITPSNAGELELKWVFQADASSMKMEATPLVVNGIMYITEPPNNIIALDAKTGAVFWVYNYPESPGARACCGSPNRGLAMLGNTLFMGTLDSHLVAIDAKGGTPLWNTQIGTPGDHSSITEAPLVVKDKVIVGVSGAEGGVRGFVAAYSVETGEQIWRFNTIPGPGEAGHDTWPSDTWQRGGGSSWIPGTYDPDLNLVFWGIGNPYPDMNPDVRKGDNLYTDSALALDPDTGKLKWYYQFSPNDGRDWDSIQVPVLAEMQWNGAPRKVIYWANRNGYFYVLDRATGKFLRATPFVKTNWAKGFDKNGRPIPADNTAPTVGGTRIYPGTNGGTNWYSPSFSPHTGLFYIPAWEDYSSVFTSISATGNGPAQGLGFPKSPMPTILRGPIDAWTDAVGHGEVKAFDPQTGEQKWAFKMDDVTDAGILTTASDMLFTANREGYFLVFDARNGTLLWRARLGAQIPSAPVTYTVEGKQYVSICAGHALFTFGLRQ